MCLCVCQRKGDPCAAKIFTAAETVSKVRVKQNEIEFMRMLDHTNIVRFFAIEEDVRYVTLRLFLCSRYNDSSELIMTPDHCTDLAGRAGSRY